MSWIKLQIHPEHDKVLALADLTGASPEKVLAAAIRWFLWVDAHAEDANIQLSRRAFRDVTRWKGDTLADAMLDGRVDWLTENAGMLAPTRWDTHMSAGAKVRAMEARARAARRALSDSMNGTSVGHCVGQKPGPEKEKDKSKKSPAPPAPSGGVAHNGTGGGGGGMVTLTTEQAENYRLIVERPAWLPEGEPWIDAAKARDLAALPTTSAALIAHYARETRQKRKHLNRPGGYMVAKLSNPDGGVVASLQTHQITVSDIHDMAQAKRATS